MKTIKTSQVDKTVLLRLVDTGKQFVGLAIANGAEKLRIEGDNADEVWNRLERELGKNNPKYVGFDGARNRFLHFFPNGFRSEGYDGDERRYKLAAKTKLDQTVPLGEAADGSGFGEAVL